MSTAASALELDLTRIGTNILIPIHSTHSHRASEDIEEDPTRAVAARSCHCVRDMALLTGNTLTPLLGSPFLRPVLLWARSCSRTRPFAFTSLARTIRDLNCRMQRAERRLVRQEDWPVAVVEHKSNCSSLTGVSYRSIMYISATCIMTSNSSHLRRRYTSAIPSQLLCVAQTRYAGFGPATSRPSRPSIGSSGRLFALCCDCCAAVRSSSLTAYSARYPSCTHN
jgi:hypothetical protein